MRETQYVTDGEVQALQSYLDAGGTIVIDDVSLKYNEYQVPRTTSLSVSNGNIITANTSAEVREEALKQVTQPELILSETNGNDLDACLWRVTTNAQGENVMVILNLGNTTGKISITENGNKVDMTDLYTGNQLGEEFEIPSEGVLVLVQSN
ncbi:MAG: hypothetical protein R3Y63_07185 [Eubacteriales bacterium]